LSQYTAVRFASGDPRLDAITARHALSQTSGWQNVRSRSIRYAFTKVCGTEPLAPRSYTSTPAVARYGAMGGLLTTAADYARFRLAVMAPAPEDPFRLRPASIREMLTPHVRVEEGPGYSIRWALGWKVAETRDFGTLFSHGGDQAGFHWNPTARARRAGAPSPQLVARFTHRISRSPRRERRGSDQEFLTPSSWRDG